MNQKDAARKLVDLMKDIDFCMLTTLADDKSFHARPMTLQQAEFDGNLWLFTSRSGPVGVEVERDSRVGVTFTSRDFKHFVTIAGTGRLTRDEAKMKELWRPLHEAWFPDGLSDPDLVLLAVEVERASYWDSNGMVTTLIEMVRAIATGDRAKPGEHETVEMHSPAKRT